MPLTNDCKAQKIELTVDRPQVLIGESIQLNLKIKDVTIAKEYITNWPTINTENGIEIISATAIDTLQSNGLATYIQTIQFTSFDTGTHTLLLSKAILKQKNSTVTDTLSYAPIVINIAAANVNNLQNLHPAKVLIDIEKPISLLPIIVISIALLMLISIYFFKKRSKKKTVQKVVEPIDALQSFKFEILALQKQDITNKMVREQWAENVIDAYKNYLSAIYSIETTTATSSDLLHAINFKTDADTKQKITQLLVLLDGIKFANYEPNISAETILQPLVQEYFTKNNTR